MERREGGEERQSERRLARKSSQRECGVFLDDARFFFLGGGIRGMRAAGGGEESRCWMDPALPAPCFRKGGWMGAKPAASGQRTSLASPPWARGWGDSSRG